MRIRPRRSSRPIFVGAVAMATCATALVSQPVAANAAALLSTTTKLTSSATTIASGGNVHLTATVKTLGEGGFVVTPTGTVTFSATNGGPAVNLGTSTVTANCLVLVTPCVATVDTTALPVGVDTVVAHYNGDTLSKPSSGTLSITVEEPPPAPSLTSTTTTQSTITVNWTPPLTTPFAPVDYYDVYRSTDGLSRGAKVARFASAYTSYYDTSVVTNSTYWYTVTSENLAGEGPDSNTLSATPTFPPPSAPAITSITAAIGSLTVNWNVPASGNPITSYRLYRSTISGSYSSSPYATITSGTSYGDNAVAYPTHYYYKVSAVSSSGEGAKSSEATAVPLAPPTAPNAPSLTATSAIGGIKLSWTTPANGGSPITGYSVYRGTSANGEGATAIASGLPTTSYTDTTVAVGTLYYYKVTATNAVGESPRSNEASTSATSYSGSGSYATQTCGGSGPACTSSSVAGTDSNGLVTNAVLTTASTSAQTLTLAIAGSLNGCNVPGSGMGTTFNSTATDAGKTIKWTVHGAEAVNTHNDYTTTTGHEGCLGLGFEWYVGSLSNPAPYNATDGLYEAAPVYCANNGAFVTGPGTYSQPCVNSIDGSALSSPYYEIDYVMPAGDGKIGGGIFPF